MLANVRACDVRRLLELILEIAIEEQANPTRPRVGCLILCQPSPHVLPFCVRRRTDLVLAIYDSPEHLIVANTAPLLWANMTPCDSCRDGCTGQCAGDLPLEIWVGDRFPLLPLDVYMLFVDELHLDPRTCGDLPDVWIPICTRPSAPPISIDPASIAAVISSTAWLKAQMRTLPDLSDYDRFYDGWMDHYKVEHGCYPKDSARHFARVAERCRREILNERNGGCGRK